MNPRPPAAPYNDLRVYLRSTVILLVILTGVAGAMTLMSHGRFAIHFGYSLAIGMTTMNLAFLGRPLFRARALPAGSPLAASAVTRYWPIGWRLAGLIAFANVFGILIGTAIADFAFGQNIWRAPPEIATRSLVISLLAGLGIGFYFYANGKDRLQRDLIEQARREATEAQLALLQSQLEPHMLFNTLANLRVLIALDPPRAQAMLDRLVSFLRATLTASRAQQRHSLADELGRIEDYIALMQVRMGARLRFEIDCPEPLRRAQVPPLILQPLVENAILHGIEPKVGPGLLRITVAAAQDRLVIAVVDDGAGLPESALPDRAPSAPGGAAGDRGHGADPAGAADGGRVAGGFGLTQVRSRLATLYGPQGRLLIAPTPGGGTRAELSMPLPDLPSAGDAPVPRTLPEATR